MSNSFFNKITNALGIQRDNGFHEEDIIIGENDTNEDIIRKVFEPAYIQDIVTYERKKFIKVYISQEELAMVRKSLEERVNLANKLTGCEIEYWRTLDDFVEYDDEEEEEEEAE